LLSPLKEQYLKNHERHEQLAPIDIESKRYFRGSSNTYFKSQLYRTVAYSKDSSKKSNNIAIRKKSKSFQPTKKDPSQKNLRSGTLPLRMLKHTYFVTALNSAGEADVPVLNICVILEAGGCGKYSMTAPTREFVPAAGSILCSLLPFPELLSSADFVLGLGHWEIHI
jgi:hypothetical protein